MNTVTIIGIVVAIVIVISITLVLLVMFTGGNHIIPTTNINEPTPTTAGPITTVIPTVVQTGNGNIIRFVPIQTTPTAVPTGLV